MIRQRELIFNLRRVLASMLLLMLLLSSSGCWMMNKIVDNWSSKPKCVLASSISKSELIAHLNENISPLVSWQSSDVSIRTTTPQGIPMRVSADITVESPRNFRLIAKSLIGNEADFGSNHDRFWFWMRMSQEKRVVTVSHDDFPKIQQRMQIPFNPDWMMEALGVIPIDEANITIEKDPSNAGILQLISKQRSPSGKPVRRIIQVDTCKGYILAQSLYAEDGTLIAQATLNKYKIDKNSGIALPHEITLSWPQNKMQMKLVIGDIEVNPEYLPDEIFVIPNSPRFDLAADSRRYTLQQR